MKNNRLFLDMHVLQTVPPSCVNRDDTGSPKTAIYGGTTRARVSSQAWKKAMRDMFRDEIFDEEQVGVRTKYVEEMLKEEIDKIWNEEVEKGKKEPECESSELAKRIIKCFEFKENNKAKKIIDPEVLSFISNAQLSALAQLAFDERVGSKEEKKGTSQGMKSFTKDCLDAYKKNVSVDIALFGRMVAAKDEFNVDAAAQVAHAISTHAVHNEYDYFTAVDDCSPEDTAGAGHLGTNEFNASTMYRYATVNLMELTKNLNKPDISEIARGFIEAFVRSMPTGKQNTFANRTLPDAVYVTLRRDQPINLCGAFENAVKVGENGYAAASGEALVKHAKEVYENYTAAPDCAFVVGNMLGDLAETVSFSELLNRIAEQIDTYLHESEGV